MNELRESIAAKKGRLDRLRPLSPEALRNLEHYYDVEITYTSNAIEGNLLTTAETTLVIEQGVTIPGRPLKDHLEALDHYDAIRYVREPASEKRTLTATLCPQARSRRTPKTATCSLWQKPARPNSS